MNQLHLYSGPLSMFGMKAHIAALEKNLDIKLELVPFTTDHLYHPKNPEVLRVNPKRQVPVLIHGEVEIFDSTQIFEYLEDLAPKPALWSSGAENRARARLLEHKSDEVFFPHVIKLMGLQGNLKDPVAVTAIAAISVYYEEMDRLLIDQPFLAGAFTYADIAFYMAQVFAERMGAPMTADTKNLMSWRNRITVRPSVREATKLLIACLIRQNRPVPEFLTHNGN